MASTSDPAEMLGELGRSWGWILAFGIITIIAGAIVVANPGGTVKAFAVVFGIWLFVAGLFRLVSAFTSEGEGHRALYALLGLLSIAIGLFMVRNVFDTLRLFAFILGVFWVISGIVDFFGGIFMKDMPHRGWTIFIGALGFLAGVIVLAQPAISLATLAWIIGIWLIVDGLMLCISAFRVKKFAGGVPAAA
jgi:uncharacterized membrane protein HdeD (DUF308 family)